MKLSLASIKLLVVFSCLFLFLLTFKELGCQSLDKQRNAQSLARSGDNVSGNVFKDKEKIKFGAYSKGIKIGSGSLVYLGAETLEKEEVQHIVLEVSTFSLRDKEGIFATPDFAKPVKVERDLRVLGKNESIVEAYSPDKKTVTVTKRVDGGQPTAQVIKSQESLDNVILFIYRLRNDEELKVGKIYKINLPTQKFDLIVKDIRKIKVPLGSFEAYFLESSPAKYKIWLSSQKERTPLRIQGLMASGLVYLAAISVDTP